MGMWEEGLPDGKIDLQAMPLTSLTARMPYSDLRRIQAQWDCLTVLSIGSPDKIIVFGVEDATGVLVLTPNLIDCTITFAEAITATPSPPTPRFVPLHKLKTLTMLGTSVTVEFIAMLHLPSLTHLFAIQSSPRAQSSSFLGVTAQSSQTSRLYTHPSLRPLLSSH